MSAEKQSVVHKCMTRFDCLVVTEKQVLMSGTSCYSRGQGGPSVWWVLKK